MSAIFILLSASLCIAGLFLLAYLWSVKNGQFDDVYSPAIRILYDDNEKLVSESSSLITEKPLRPFTEEDKTSSVP